MPLITSENIERRKRRSLWAAAVVAVTLLLPFAALVPSMVSSSHPLRLEFGPWSISSFQDPDDSNPYGFSYRYIDIIDVNGRGLDQGWDVWNLRVADWNGRITHRGPRTRTLPSI